MICVLFSYKFLLMKSLVALIFYTVALIFYTVALILNQGNFVRGAVMNENKRKI